MDYIVAADSDIGISKNVNQDSLCVKTADTKIGKAALAMVCDGMGGLSKGELASATVIRSFADWFDYELAGELDNWSWERESRMIVRRLQQLNERIVRYGKSNGIQLGTTATGMICVNADYMIFHVGDTRIYELSTEMKQLTEDHTFVRREIKRGNMTEEEAKTDPRRNALVQCIGVSGKVDPEIKFGKLENDANYLICSDGFRHVVTEEEILANLAPRVVTARTSMHAKIREVIELVKKRQEKDNITAALFRAEF